MDNICEKPERTWQSAFVEMVPEIRQRLRRAFCDLDGDARNESIDEAVVHCLLTYVRLHERGRAGVATASTLVWYAVLQVKRGRPTTGRMNGRDPLSRYAQIGRGIQVEHGHGHWIDVMVEDKRASVPDQVAARMDVRAWFATLSRRMKLIAKDLALGFTTSEVAAKHELSHGRISQIRRELHDAWREFQGELATASA